MFFLRMPRKSAKRYERDLLAEYCRKGRPADGLSVPQLNATAGSGQPHHGPRGHGQAGQEGQAKCGEGGLGMGPGGEVLEG